MNYKFRAWDKNENRFWYFTLQEVLERRVSYRGSWDEKVLIGEKNLYTGYKDNDGTEIYIGDYLHVWGGESWQGYWEFDRKILIKDFGDIFFLGECENIKVIDDIYHNPELIKTA